MAKKTNKERLELWQTRLGNNASIWDAEVALMDEREALYQGNDAISLVVTGDTKLTTPHVRNIVAELIESQIDANIPQPKVAAKKQKDELKAKLIEDMLRNELDRLPIEAFNDLMERIVPMQGGGFWLIEWDNEQRTHSTIGEIALSVIHPKQIVPQDGVFSAVEDMDYIILKVPQTKEYIKRRYNVDVSNEGESEPEIKGAGESSPADDLVTQYIAYYRNNEGGIGLYSWVNDTELADMEDYQSRRLRRCKVCGAMEPLFAEPLNIPTLDGTPPIGIDTPVVGSELDALAINQPKPKKQGKGACPYCGASKWEEVQQEQEELFNPVTRSDGTVVPGAQLVGGQLEPTKIPYYKPTIYPVIMQKNVSVFGQLLGDSDIDKISDQQNTINRIEASILDKLLLGGSYMLIPDRAEIAVDPIQKKIVYPGTMEQKALFGSVDMALGIEQDMAYLTQAYEEARQVIGITDSFQGRQDRTATSGKAKEFAAAQTAGRLESKRVFKDFTYSQIFEAIFKFKLAYADEPRPVVSEDIYGDRQYQEFNRYDFLEQDEAGEWYWNDQFLFSCDNTAPLASNREAMWQETRLNLQSGAFGDPTSKETLILFWSKMEMLHYPGAGDTKAFLEEQLQREQQQAMMMQQMQMQMQRQMQPMAQTMPQGANEAEMLKQAKNAAARDALAKAGLLGQDGMPIDMTSSQG